MWKFRRPWSTDNANSGLNKSTIDIERKRASSAKSYHNRLEKSEVNKKVSRVKLAKSHNLDLEQQPIGKSLNISIYELIIILVVSLIVIAGVTYNHHEQLNKNSKAAVTSKEEAATQAKSANVTQSDSLFSKSPTWSQDYSNITSGSINQKYWNINVGPPDNSNKEAEYYTGNKANLRVQNGALTLEATKQAEPDGLDYASARVDTSNKVEFSYGRIDVTAKIPNGTGTWPAIWFLPATNTYENLSPRNDLTRYENGGEIDLVEEVGDVPNLDYGIVHTLNGEVATTGSVPTYNTITIADSNTIYNKYTLLWTPTSLTFEVNDKPFYTYTKPENSTYKTWPFDQPFYMILNLALGGIWGGADSAQYPPYGVNDAALPSSMQIKSIYYYPYVGSPVVNNN